MPRPGLLSALSLLLLLGSEAATASNPAATAELLRARLEGATEATIQIGTEEIVAHPDLFRFYADRDYAPAWGAHGSTLLALVEESVNDGLDPEAYRARWIGVALAAASAAPDAAADRELLLTDAFFRLGEHLLRGRVDPTTIAPERKWYPTRRERDLAALLDRALVTGDIAGALDALRPQHPAYRKLRDALGRYRTLAEAGTDLPIILPASTLTEGDESVRVPLVRQRLALFGDLADAEPTGENRLLYSAAVADAVRRFQARHGLEVNGTVDQPTRTALNRSPEHWVRTLTLNLERWRWLPDDLGARHILVNMPAFRLQVMEDGAPALAMNVVVGNPSWQTPVFSDTMETVVFNPTWGVPPSIAAVETIPLARSKGSEYLSSRGYNVYREGEQVDPSTVDWEKANAGQYYFVQSPGPANPLGTVKFAFPNANDIYIHDTNQKRLFSRAQRAFSHGCIRAAEPHALAEHLLGRDKDWTPEKVQEKFAAGRLEYVPLDAPLPVHLVYLTAAVDAEGGIAFYDDVYGYDDALATALGLDG